jgi:hypothetical protein
MSELYFKDIDNGICKWYNTSLISIKKTTEVEVIKKNLHINQNIGEWMYDHLFTLK